MNFTRTHCRKHPNKYAYNRLFFNLKITVGNKIIDFLGEELTYKALDNIEVNHTRILPIILDLPLKPSVKVDIKRYVKRIVELKGVVK